MMSPCALMLLSWVVAAAAAWAAMEADATGSALTMAIAAMCGVVFALLQGLAFSLALGRRQDAILAALRAAAGVPANDGRL